jgi:hypothetical protein
MTSLLYSPDTASNGNRRLISRIKRIPLHTSVFNLVKDRHVFYLFISPISVIFNFVKPVGT